MNGIMRYSLFSSFAEWLDLHSVQVSSLADVTGKSNSHLYSGKSCILLQAGKGKIAGNGFDVAIFRKVPVVFVLKIRSVTPKILPLEPLPAQME